MEINYEEKADSIIANSKELLSDIKEGGVKYIPIAIKSVEIEAIKDGFKGDDKKRLAISIINKLINIPVIPEWLEGKIIGFAIDAIITTLNKFFGKDWSEKIA